jgi:hypothetical protein
LKFDKLKWGGISSEEHDEAVMLEAAMFGGIPEGTGYRFPYTPHHQFMQNENHYPRPVPRPPSPSLQAQRLIREQQVWLLFFDCEIKFQILGHKVDAVSMLCLVDAGR